MSRTPYTHYFNVSSPVFMQFQSGARSFHVCFDDQDFKLGDIVVFREVERSGRPGGSTGQETERKIIGTHRKLLGLIPAYLVLGLA